MKNKISRKKLLQSHHIVRLMIVTIFTTLVFSCHKTVSVKEVPIIDLSDEIEVVNVPLSKIAKKVEYISLESDTTSFISQISSIVLSDNYILILDRDLNNILLFDKNGKFLRPVGKRGRGPGEFVTPFAIEISSDELFVYIYTTGDQILEFGINGHFNRSINTKGVKFQHFMEENGNFILATPFPMTRLSEDYMFTIIEKNGHIIKQMLKKEPIAGEAPIKINSSNSLYKINNNYVYWQYIYDTVYGINSQLELVPRFRLILGQNSLKRDAFENATKLRNQNYSGSFSIDRIVESPRCLFFMTTNNSRLELIVYDKELTVPYKLDLDFKDFIGLVNDLDNGPNFWPTRLINDTTLISYINPEAVFSKDTSVLSGYKGTPFDSVLCNLSIISNPVIVKVILK